MPLFLWFFPPGEAIFVCACYGVIVGILIILSSWQKLEKQMLFELLCIAIFSIIGMFFGTKCILFFNKIVIEWILIIILLTYPLFYFNLFKNIQIKFSFFSSLLFGLFCGFLGGSTNANGPLFSLYTQVRKFSRDVQLSFLQPLFLIGSIYNTIYFHVNSDFSSNIYYSLLFAVPVIILNMFLGKKIRSLIGEKFDIIVVWLVFAIGVSMLFRVII